MIVRKEIDITKPLTADQVKMLDDLETRPITFDEDCPELTEEQLAEFHRVSEIRKEERRKKTVTIRLSSRSLSKAKSLGKGYTSVLSRILEEALEDDDFIRKCL